MKPEYSLVQLSADTNVTPGDIWPWRIYVDGVAYGVLEIDRARGIAAGGYVRTVAADTVPLQDNP